MLAITGRRVAVLIIVGGVVGLIGIIDPQAIQLKGSADESKAFLASLSALASGLVLLVLAGFLNNTDSIRTQQRFAELTLERLNKAGQQGD